MFFRAWMRPTDTISGAVWCLLPRVADRHFKTCKTFDPSIKTIPNHQQQLAWTTDYLTTGCTDWLDTDLETFILPSKGNDVFRSSVPKKQWGLTATDLQDEMCAARHQRLVLSGCFSHCWHVLGCEWRLKEAQGRCVKKNNQAVTHEHLSVSRFLIEQASHTKRTHARTFQSQT